MHRKNGVEFLFLTLLALGVLSVGSLAQDSSQTIPVTPPPTRRIEPPPANATPQDLDERGDQLRGEKAYLDAMDYFQAALKKCEAGSKFSAVLYNKIATTQLQLTRDYEARKSFEKSIKIDKTYAKSYNNLGVVFYHDKKYGRAIKHY